MRLLIVFVVVCFSFFNAQAQLSKTHFIPPITTGPGSTNNPDNARPGTQFLHVSTPTSEVFDVQITLSGVTQNYSLSNLNSLEIPLGSGFNTPFVIDPQLGASVLSDTGIIINAEQPVYASVRLLSADFAQAGSLVSKGLAGLGKDFRAGTFTNLNSNDNGLWLSFISVMATENGTEINFTDLDNDVEFFNNSTNTSNITLNAGDVYVISCVPSTNNNGDAFIGARITSNKNVVVNSGSTNGSNDANNAQGGSGRDYGIDQIAPLKTIIQSTGDSDYIFVRGNGSGTANIERPIIVANEDDTKVYVGGNLYATLPLAGDYVSIDETEYGSTFPGANMYVYSDKTTYAYQGIGGTANRANQELFFVPPLSCKTPRVIDNIPAIELVGSTAGASFNGNVTIVTRRFKKGSTNPNIVEINGVALPLSLAEPVDGTDFDSDGNSDYVTYLDINLNGDVSVSSDESIYVSYFGANGSAAMGGFYSGFIFKSEITSELEVGAVESCIDNINKLELSSLEEFDTYQWYYKPDSNASFVLIPGATNEILDFNNPPSGVSLDSGFYQLEGIIFDADGITPCESIISSEIPVSECPGDSDNDGVNNNLDVDIDNDGIVNNLESNCNIQFDLSASSGPYFNNAQFVNSPSNTETSQGFLDQSFLLSASKTVVNNPSSVNYNIQFSQPISFVLTQANTSDSANSAIDDNEFFTVSVPSSQTLSVYDPDDQLLIDTNYDGIYESNTNQFTSFEIRFKLNGTNLNNGQGTFEFKSRLAASLKIEYENSDENNPNSAALKLLQGCLDTDFDSDGVSDLIDLDTDNDGIFDVIESGNSNLDTDGDGRINDVVTNDTNFNGHHDSAATNPLNTDGIDEPNYLDKDSDGDFIWDVVEGGNHDLDLDLNGVIDASLFQDANSDGYHDNANKIPVDSDSDSEPDYIELDSDNDGCSDSFERGNPGSSIITIPLPSDTDGDLVFDYQFYTKVVSAPLIDELILCESFNETLTVTLDSSSSSYDIIAWQINNGSGWNDIIGSTTFLDANTPILEIINVNSTNDGSLLRARFSRNDYVCSDWFSEEVLLSVNSLPVISSSWSGELIQCDDDTDGKSVFNLLEARERLSVNYLNETFEFYTDITDSSTLITNPNSYSNTVPNQIVQVKISNTASGCFIEEDVLLRALSNDLSPTLIQQNFQSCYDFTTNNAFFDFSSVKDPFNPGMTISFDDYVLNTYSDGVTRKVTYYESYTNALTEENAIVDLTAFEVSGSPEGGTVNIWVRVDDEFNSCNGIKDLITLETLADTSFIVDPNILNPLNPSENELVICNTVYETIELILNTPVNSANIEFEWVFPDGTSNFSTIPEYDVSDEGNYEVYARNILNQTCEFQETFKVSRYTINDPQLSFFDIISGTKRNAIKLKDINDESVFGPNNYEFKLLDEDGNEVNSNFIEVCEFKDLTGGFYTLVVRDEAQCDEKSIVIPILYFPTFITPNGDGYNDTWEVKGIDLSDYNLQLTKIYIFNRYGKLIGSFDLDQSWDGTFNGTPLEATDYWYKVDLVKKSGEVLQPIRGHFSLLK